MHNVKSPQGLNILVVTEDRALARQTSRFLTRVGYRVTQAAEGQSALAAAETGCPHVMILGASLAARANWELCHLLDERQAPARAFKFLLIDEPDERQLQEALEAGIDDFLVSPLCYGELLSRLRAAARVLEHDRRAGEQGRSDAVTGLASGPAFCGHLRQQWTAAVGARPRVACVVLDVDFFGRVQHALGIAAGNALLKAVVQELNNLRVGSEILGCLGGDRFAAMLPGASETSATEWAERTRQVLAATKFKAGKSTLQITASFGVSSSDSADSAEQVIEQASGALQTAKESGRNCVVRWAEHEGESCETSAAGKLFDGTLARHVMTPVSVFVQAAEPVGQAAELFRQTGLEAIPVLDPAGKLVGLCKKDAIVFEGDPNEDARRVRDVMTTAVQSFRAQEDLSELMDFFNQDPLAVAVVNDAGRPVGLVNCDSLLALSQPVALENLAPQSAYADSSEYLLVLDHCPVEAEQPA